MAQPAWNKSIEIQNKNDEYLFVNPEHGSWLRINGSVKQMLDDFVNEGERLNEINKAKQLVLNQFIQSGMIILNNEEKCHVSKKQLKSIYLTVTKTCNLSCDFCSMGSFPQKFEQLSTKEIMGCIDKLKSVQCNRIIITGGEPFIRSDIFKIIDYMNENLSCKLIISTNGLLLTEGKIQNMKGKVSRIDMSVENIFSSNRKSEYEKLKNITKHLHNNEIDLSLSYVLTRENWCNVFNFFDYVAQNNTGMSLKIVAPVGNAREHQNLFNSEASLSEIYIKLFEYIYQQGYSGRAFQQFLFPKFVPSYSCSAKNKILSINIDGKVYSCHSLLYPEFCIGDIRLESSSSIIESSAEIAKTPFYRNSLDVDQRDICNNCQVRYFCQGACFAEVYQNEDRIGPLPPECGIKKAIILFNLWHYKKRKTFLENLKEFTIFFKNFNELSN